MMSLEKAKEFYLEFKPLYEKKRLRGRTQGVWIVDRMDEPTQKYINDDKSYDVLLHCTWQGTYRQLWIQEAIKEFGKPPILATD